MHLAPRLKSLFILALLAAPLSGCEYLQMTRPSVLSELTPPVVRMVDYLPQVDQPNDAVLARLFATGGLDHAKMGKDGVMHVEMWVMPNGQMVWTPALIVMPSAGELEVTVHNPDDMHHMAYMPSDGGRQLLDLPPKTSGVVRISLSQTGMYWFGCPVANHAARGMLGFIFVEGKTPEVARLDRPRQPQPTRD